MKSIQTLIKLQQRQLDEKRRVLKELLDQEAMLVAKKEETKQAILEEQKRSMSDIQAAYTLPAFIKKARSDIQTMEDYMVGLRKQADAVRDEIAAIFQELKRYEIYDEMKETEKKDKADKREQKLMDEMGLRSFVYKDVE